MKKCDICKLIALVAGIAAVIGAVVGVLLFLKKRRDELEADYYEYYEEFPDEEAPEDGTEAAPVAEQPADEEPVNE